MRAGLWEQVERRAAESPEALLAVDERDRRLTFSGLRDAALRCAAALAESGVGEDTPVSWLLPTRLETLVLKENPVTDASVEQLARMKGLKNLDISLTQISDDGAEQLAEALPDCKISR